ncbi:MAG: beta-lactamase family protein [Lutibacter sp.]|nr:beta-lactamase family protein [Lutibacter sp.]MBP9600138.1 beta-lactamase family protein [Lutibacter sp.]
MKNYIKYFTITCIIFASIIFRSSNYKPSEITRKIVPLTKENKFQVERYTKEETKSTQLKLDEYLERLHKFNDFNGSLLVAKNGKIIYENQVGYADFGKKAPINESSIFQLASVSKQFTAAAIMLLYERNQIELSDSVKKYFPNFPYEHVTIKNLLNHTAGLPKYFWVAENFWSNEKAPTNSEIMHLLETSNVQRNYKPGNAFEYSNTGYLVLASIVEKLSGISFDQFLKENIFDPLGMENSYVYCLGEDCAENQLDGFRLYKGRNHLKINTTVNDRVVGDKNVYSTCEDLFKWINGLNTGKLISTESLSLMYSKGITNSGKEVPYGFGFRIDNKDDDAIYHYGKWNGFSTSLKQYPKDDLVIIVLEHTSYSGMNALNKKVKEIVVQNFKS